MQIDLEFFRLRLKNNREIIAAPSKLAIVIVVQSWKTAAEIAAHIVAAP